MANILSVAQSALTAAQVGLTTTGHNIANANTPGYSRQVVIQGTATSQDSGFGFVGKGTQVTGVKRVYDDYLASRVLTSQSSSNALDSYYSQIKQINNMFADPTVGFSPAMKDFFAGVQSVAANPNSTAARQTMLSSGEALASQLQSMDGQLRELGDGVTSQVNTSIETINSYAQQIATLNDAIEKAQAGNDGKPANDLLDQRDQVVSDLSKEIKVSVVKQNDSYSVFIGNGQPLVVSTKTFDLVPSASSTDPSRAEVGYQSNGKTITLAENAITGGKLGGLFEFRAKTLDSAQNALGRIAIGLASTFNAQHELGQDQNGALGGAFFTAGTPLSKASSANTSDAQVAASITDVNALTGSDYQLKWDGANYTVTRLSDNKSMYSAATFPAASIDGVAFSLQLQPPTNTPPSAGDAFLIRPTVNGAADFRVAITDTKEIAVAAPMRTMADTLNTGSGKISAGTVNAPPPADGNLQQPVSITFTSSTTFNVTGTGTGSPTAVAYTPGSDITYNGWTVQISGTPAAGDTFTISKNDNGAGDNRNALLLGALQTKNTLDNGGSTYQGAYGQLVSAVGNKTHELEVTGSAESKLLAQTVEAQQSSSGVNLDEEATNLLRYQQAYQAAAKVMQTAGKLFDVLLSLGQ